MPDLEERDSTCPFCHLALHECACEEGPDDIEASEEDICEDCDMPLDECECEISEDDEEEED